MQHTHPRINGELTITNWITANFALSTSLERTQYWETAKPAKSSAATNRNRVIRKVIFLAKMLACIEYTKSLVTAPSRFSLPDRNHSSLHRRGRRPLQKPFDEAKS